MTTCQENTIPDSVMEKWMESEKREKLISFINEVAKDAEEYETQHVDSGSNYAHMPAECWTASSLNDLCQSSYNPDNLQIFIETAREAGVDDDTTGDWILDNFEMSPSNVYGRSLDCIDSYTVGEGWTQIDSACLEEYGFSIADIEMLLAEGKYGCKDLDCCVSVSWDCVDVSGFCDSCDTWEAIADVDSLFDCLLSWLEDECEERRS